MHSALVFLICALTFVASQRPPYAPNPVRYPDVAYRFRTPETESQATEAELSNRNADPSVSTTTIRLPIDARGNVDVVEQYNRWNEEHRPFWYINAEAIERNRARPVPAQGQDVQVNAIPSRSGFLP